MNKKAVLLSALLLLVTELVTVGIAQANPSWAPLVHTISPEKDKIYFSTSVELKVQNDSGYWIRNVKNFRYVLDGQAPVMLNSTEATISNLSAGSHHLVLYADYASYGGDLLDDIYFNVYYSPPIVTFLSITLPLIAIFSFVLIKKRKQIKSRINRAASGFWWGLGLFILALISVAPYTFILINRFLFPSSFTFSLLSHAEIGLFFFGGIFLMFISIPMILWGTRKKAVENNLETTPKLQNQP